MQIAINYNKAKVIQALRYHFISKKEIKLLMILVNVFAILSALLFYFKKIRPEPFLLSTTIWLLMLITIWYILPFSIYRKNSTFQQQFIIEFGDTHAWLNSPKGTASWTWQQFTEYKETPNFFHLYFDKNSFFLVPKDELNIESCQQARDILAQKIKA